MGLQLGKYIMHLIPYSICRVYRRLNLNVVFIIISLELTHLIEDVEDTVLIWTLQFNHKILIAAALLSKLLTL